MLVALVVLVSAVGVVLGSGVGGGRWWDVETGVVGGAGALGVLGGTRGEVTYNYTSVVHQIKN